MEQEADGALSVPRELNATLVHISVSFWEVVKELQQPEPAKGCCRSLSLNGSCWHQHLQVGRIRGWLMGGVPKEGSNQSLYPRLRGKGNLGILPRNSESFCKLREDQQGLCHAGCLHSLQGGSGCSSSSAKGQEFIN